MTVAVLKGSQFWTPVRKLYDAVVIGRPPGRLPGGYVMDLVDLRKAITLCRDCVHKFNAPKVGYVTKVNLPFVRGRCDGCSQHTDLGHLLVHHTLANLL